MFSSRLTQTQLAQSSLGSAIGYQCKLSATNHPDADQYQGRECRIVAVKVMSSGKPMLTIQFPDGTQVKGVFFSELEDDMGRPLHRHRFE